MQIFSVALLGSIVLLIAIRAATCGCGDGAWRSLRFGAFRIELQRVWWAPLSCSFKMLAMAFRPVGHHLPWLWTMPLIVMGLGGLLEHVRRKRGAESRYSRSLRLEASKVSTKSR